MAVRVAINGFGRIGRLVLRAAYEHKNTEIEVVGVRQSNSRKEYGVVRTRTLAYNQRDQVVMRSTVNFLAPVKPKA